MESEGRKATAKQRAYIEDLAGACKATIATPLNELTVEGASTLIEELRAQLNGSNGAQALNGRALTRGYRRDAWSAGARIGLAFKVCYQRWIRSGENIFRHKEQFVKDVRATYQLLNDIAQQAEAA